MNLSQILNRSSSSSSDGEIEEERKSSSNPSSSVATSENTPSSIAPSTTSTTTSATASRDTTTTTATPSSIVTTQGSSSSSSNLSTEQQPPFTRTRHDSKGKKRVKAPNSTWTMEDDAKLSLTKSTSVHRYIILFVLFVLTTRHAPRPLSRAANYGYTLGCTTIMTVAA
uniref:ARAD1C10560p n=1 Tax=Blastobotrys adeninivorans TaxID=409370 RepID=A0A060SZR7_BLAAD